MSRWWLTNDRPPRVGDGLPPYKLSLNRTRTHENYRANEGERLSREN
ncbi:MAG: hypothetical protein H0U72_10735 [Nitrosospira sp.]|nr:hypothetical protein [Nitrosospira sp.]